MLTRLMRWVELGPELGECGGSPWQSMGSAWQHMDSALFAESRMLNLSRQVGKEAFQKGQPIALQSTSHWPHNRRSFILAFQSYEQTASKQDG
jgi:hypothetical protein